MKINNSLNANGILKAYTNQNKKAKIDQTEAKNSQADRVEISAQAKELSQIQQKASEIPEINLERVAEIKAQIQNGEYQVSSKELAQKMLEEIYKK